MKLDALSSIVSLLLALSIASERLVAIIKGMVPYLNLEKADPTEEGRRSSALQALAVVSGIVTTFLASPVTKGALPEDWNNPFGLLALGLLASGGSGFWNSIQGYLSQAKDIKKLQAEQQKQLVAATRTDSGTPTKPPAPTGVIQ